MPRTSISVPASLKPLIDRPADWPPAWRVAVAACRASGVVAWAARLDSPARGEPSWLQGRSPSQPQVVQSECMPALIAALEAIPVGAAVEVIAATSLRYLVEGVAFPAGSPQHDLAQLAAARRIWPRYALGELEALVATCLSRAYDSLAPLPWPLEELFPGVSVSAWADYSARFPESSTRSCSGTCTRTMSAGTCYGRCRYFGCTRDSHPHIRHYTPSSAYARSRFCIRPSLFPVETQVEQVLNVLSTSSTRAGRTGLVPQAALLAR